MLDVETITEGLKVAVGSIENLVEEYAPLALVRYVACEGGDEDLCSELWGTAGESILEKSSLAS